MNSDAIHIGFDLDGVLIDHAQTKVELAAEYGVNIMPVQTNAAVLRTLMQPDDYEELRSRLYNDPATLAASPLMHGATDALQSLQKAGIRFSLISRRKDTEMAFNLLEHHGLRPTFLKDENTFFVREDKDKENVARTIGITHYIDDKTKVLDVVTSVPNRYLMDPHGALEESGDYVIVRSHPEFIGHFVK